MSASSDYLEKKLLDHALGTASFTTPGTVFLALFTTDDSAGNTAEELETGDLTNEVTGNGYARQTISFNAANASGTATNNGAVTFTASGGAFGTITHVAVMDTNSTSDSAGAGNVLFYGALTASKTIEDGDSFQIADTNLSITLA